MYMFRRPVILACLVAVTALTAFGATASANHFSISGGRFEARSTAVTFSSSGFTVRCQVTVNGSFITGSFAKTVGLRAGSINEMRSGTCEGGEVMFLNLPITLAYQSFTGVLPNIEKINLREEGLGVQVNFMNTMRCLYKAA